MPSRTTLTYDDIITLQYAIQRTIDNKELVPALEHYDPDIIYIGPAFQQMIVGKDALKNAFGRHFQNPQRMSTVFKEIKIQSLQNGDFIVNCQVDGKVGVYFSETHFKGYLTRVFSFRGDKPLIVCEHFSMTP